MADRTGSRWTGRVAALAAMLACVGSPPAGARDGQPDSADRAQQAADRAARETARAQERADRDAARFAEDKAKIIERAPRDPARAEAGLARQDADQAKDAAKASRDAERIAADLAEEQQKAAEDAARDAQRAAEDAAEDAARSAESTSGGQGSSAAMRGLAADEAPEFDRRGFPVRRGEVVGLDPAPALIGAAQAHGFRLISNEPLAGLGSRIVRLAVPDGMDAQEAVDWLRRADPAGRYDHVHYYGLHYGQSGERPARPAAGTATTASPRRREGLVVGMIDTGLARHPQLMGSRIVARDFSDGGGRAEDHGTAIASILVSEGADQIYAGAVFRGRASGEPYTSADSIVQALEWLVTQRVPVVNISLAGPRNAILDALLVRAARSGTMIVAAAGNGGPTAPPAYPAALGPVIAVTAVDRAMHVYRYANQGSYITVAARGVAEPAAKADGGIGLFSGTSFAAPHVAAWLARCRKTRGGDCAARLREQARDLGEPGFDPVYGHGFVG